jgi:asparagine synthase (glutamine-hydrolysing)
LTSRGARSAFLEGALHDRDELARTLGADARAADVDLVLLAYERWGVGAFARLRGSFALGLLDRSNGTACLATDPIGHRPLFRTEHSGTLIASTSPAALLAYPGVSRELNRGVLADHLCHRWIGQDETYFAAIRRVLPGAHLRVSSAGTETVPHWDPQGDASAAASPGDELLASFDAALERAVVRGLRGSRSAIFLSGGLDSISVAAVAADCAARSHAPPPRALSLAFPDPACDERAIQRSVAGDLGLPLDLVEFYDAVGSEGRLLDLTLELNRIFHHPALNPWGPAYLTLAGRAVEHDVGTILTGSGGDEWLTVSPFLAADLLRRGDLLRLARFIRGWQRSSARPAWRVAWSALWRFGTRPAMGGVLGRAAPAAWDQNRLRRALAADPAWVAPDANLRAEQSRRAERHLVASNPPSGFYFREMRTSLNHPLILREHEEFFQWGRLAGVTLHHPYWDPDLVSLLYSTPPEVLDRGGRSKGLVRDSVARRFPKLGFERQRKVISSNFFMGILLKEGPGVARRLGPPIVLASLGIVNGRLAADTIDRAFDRPGREAYRAWDLLNLESWARNHL